MYELLTGAVRDTQQETLSIDNWSPVQQEKNKIKANKTNRWRNKKFKNAINKILRTAGLNAENYLNKNF